MADVFISYAREDAALAERLAGALGAAGYSCWWDRNLAPGTRYLIETEAQLKASKAVVVIWSQTSINSHWVADEAAVGRDDNRLVSLSFDGSMPPLGFRQFQVADLSGWTGDGASTAFRILLAGLERLVAPGASTSTVAAAPVATAANVSGNLPRRLEPLIGREAELAQIGALLAEASLVTLTGPGGIGKTRLAIEAARRATGQHADGVFLVELAPLTDAAAIPGAIARAMGIELRDNPSTEIVERLRSWRALIVLDNCEHLIEALAGLAEDILQMAPDVRLLATSQEILGLEGERVVRLRSLGEADAERLFLRAVRAADPEFSPAPVEGSAIRAICARLDGIALAIEMAAAHAPVIGCGELLNALDDRFRVLTAGRRTALPRQRTLQATLDWSHGLLTVEEAAVFRRLAVFSGGSTLEAARGVIADERLDVQHVTQALSVLSRKSLVVIDRSDAVPRYRLLETMRAYAQQKLLEAGETQLLQRRHAGYFASFFEPALETALGAAERLFMPFASETGNLQAALGWCFSPEGDEPLGVTLAAHGFIALELTSRFDDVIHWTRRAMSCKDSIPVPLYQRLLAGHTRSAFISDTADVSVVEHCEREVPRGADRLARTVTLMVSAQAANIWERAVPLSDIFEEASGLGWPKACPASLFPQIVMLLTALRANTSDSDALRARADAFIAAAREAGSESYVLVALSVASTSEVPWDEDPDRAIDAARARLAAVLDKKNMLPRTSILLTFIGRLIGCLCERKGPGDLAEARSLAVLVDQRFGLSQLQRMYMLASLCMAEGRFLDAARCYGWLRNFPVFRTYASSLFQARGSRLIEQMRAALPPAVFEQALEDGARLTAREAFNLALGKTDEVARA